MPNSLHKTVNAVFTAPPTIDLTKSIAAKRPLKTLANLLAKSLHSANFLESSCILCMNPYKSSDVTGSNTALQTLPILLSINPRPSRALVNDSIRSVLPAGLLSFSISSLRGVPVFSACSLSALSSFICSSVKPRFSI